MDDKTHQTKHAAIDQSLDWAMHTLYTLAKLMLELQRNGKIKMTLREQEDLLKFERFFLFGEDSED